VPWDQDPDAITTAMRDAAASLEGDETMRGNLLAPIEIYGIDAIDPGNFTVKARIKTVPLKQWIVGRALRGRLLAIFKERGLEIPRPAVQVVVDQSRIVNRES
jgi:small conductance mechanosensitive channel